MTSIVAAAINSLKRRFVVNESDGTHSELVSAAIYDRLDAVNDAITAYPLGHSATNITTQTTTTVKSGAGVLHAIDFTAAPSGVITIYDNTAGSGTKLRTIASPAPLLQSDMCKVLNIAFTTGLTIVTSGANQDITVIWR